MNDRYSLQPFDSPIASVLMPVYNGDAFLVEAIDSALAQTEKNIEIVAVDDGSTDSSREILYRYAAQDTRVRVFEEKHQGLVATLNRGLEVARGKYICRLDADDIATLNRVEKQVRFLEEHPDYVLVGGQVTLVNTAGETIRTRKQSLSTIEIEQELGSHNPFIHSSVMYRRVDALHAGGYDPAFLHTEDYELWVRLAANHRLGNVPDEVCRYRVHENQVSSTNLLRQSFTAHCIRAAFRGASREAIKENVQAEEKDFMPALRRLGYSDDEIAAGIAGGYLIWVSQLNSAGNRELAFKLLSDVQKYLKEMKASSRYLAQTYSWEFIVSLGAHNFLRAARSLFLAFASAPRKTARNILGRLFTPLAIAPTGPLSEHSVK